MQKQLVITHLDSDLYGDGTRTSVFPSTYTTEDIVRETSEEMCLNLTTMTLEALQEILSKDAGHEVGVRIQSSPEQFEHTAPKNTSEGVLFHIIEKCGKLLYQSNDVINFEISANGVQYLLGANLVAKEQIVASISTVLHAPHRAEAPIQLDSFVNMFLTADRNQARYKFLFIYTRQDEDNAMAKCYGVAADLSHSQAKALSKLTVSLAHQTNPSLITTENDRLILTW